MQQGPFELEELLDMPVNENTKVWFEGLAKWYPAGTLPEMRPLFDGTLRRAETMTVPPPKPADASPAAPSEVIIVEETPEETTVYVAESAPIEPPTPPRAPLQPAVPVTPAPPCPPSYLVWGIVLTICCCSPLAIGVIIASVMVGSNYARGNYAGAERASEWAQWLIMLTLALGILPIIFLCIFL